MTEPLVGFRLTRWLYGLCWTGTERPSKLFERATAWLLAHKILLPGCSTLERFVVRLRSRVEIKVWRLLGRGITSVFYKELDARYATVRRYLPAVLNHVEFERDQKVEERFT